MRLVYVASSIDPAQGGVAEAVRSLALAQAAAGHEVQVVTLDSPEAAYVGDYPLPLHAIGTGRGGYGHHPEFVGRLRVLAQGADAVIVNGLWQYCSLGTWKALRREGPPYFVFPHGMLDPYFRRAYPLKHLKKWLYWTLAERRVLRDACAVFFTCEEERLLARRTFWLYRCHEEVVGLGCAAPPLEPERQKELFFQRRPELRGKRLVLFLGRLHDKKGCDLLIKAFGRAQSARPDPELVLVMAGPPSSDAYLRELQELARTTCPAGSVVFPGMLSGELKWGAFQAAEVFALPSHQENFGIAVAEALACGCPVLISKSVNIWREVEQDEAGFVAVDDLAGTVELLERWGRATSAERAAVSQAARRCFETRFEIKQAAQTVVATIERLI